MLPTSNSGQKSLEKLVLCRFGDGDSEAAELGGEIWERFVQDLSVADGHGSWRGKAGEGERHGEPVVAVGLADAARKGAAVDREPVLVFVEADAELPEFAAHDGDPVGLFVAQLFGFAHLGDALCEAGGDRENRELVDHADHGVATDAHGRERCSRETDVADGLAGNDTRVLDADVRAHLAEHVEDAGAGGIDPHVADADR